MTFGNLWTHSSLAHVSTQHWFEISSLRLREVKILVLTGLAAAGRRSKIWTSKLRHIGIKSSSGPADLHKTKTICQQLIQIPLPAPTPLLLPSSRIYFRSAEQDLKTNPVVKISTIFYETFALQNLLRHYCIRAFKHSLFTWKWHANRQIGGLGEESFWFSWFLLGFYEIVAISWWCYEVQRQTGLTILN